MREIKRVVVLGANGTMGSGAGALFASRGFEVSMLARTVDKAHQGLGRAKEAVRSETLEAHIRCGSYARDLEHEMAGADLVIEAVAEDLAAKTDIFEQVDKTRRLGTVVATVSSGLPIHQMAAARSADFRRHFMGIHLFNPPSVIVGTELIACADTDRDVFSSVSLLLRKRLGRQIVVCRDMPAFAGNRIGFKVLNECAQLADKHGIGRIDYLIGPYTGRAMPPLATIDLVGWDVHRAIVDNLWRSTDDEAHGAFGLPAYMLALIERGHLGNKTPAQGGFYRMAAPAEPRRHAAPSVLNPNTLSYSDSPPPVDPVPWIEEIKALHAVGRYGDGMQLLLQAQGPEADLVRSVVLGYVSYALNRVGPYDVVSEPAAVDTIMSSGFNWAPPSLLVDMWGAKATASAMAALGLKVPDVISKLPDGQRLCGQSTNIGRYFVAK